ncbi:MAG: 6,7-dimethyl-8-ribityllumazine synthase [Candidatus Eremiobacteraeota bacterium]|nr:6,7-dimethyl-8-ribityllumazine synthase [Candidatus Eremiobacteraeota bacterium]
MKRDGAGHGEASVPNCAGRRFAIVTAQFYSGLGEALIEGARRALRDCNVDAHDVESFSVPGCFELPLACRNLVESNRYDAIVALGAVVRGETPHFDYVAGECARGIMDVQLSSGVPIGFGVLTTDTYEQAEQRADPKRGDKGYHAAIAAATLLQMTSPPSRAGFR